MSIIPAVQSDGARWASSATELPAASSTFEPSSASLVSISSSSDLSSVALFGLDEASSCLAETFVAWNILAT